MYRTQYSNIRHGVHPVTLDKRDYSYHKTFRSRFVQTLVYGPLGIDTNKVMWDQNALGYPQGCTGFAQADSAGNFDGFTLDPIYTYSQTCLMEGHDTTLPCSVRNSLQSTLVSMKREGEIGSDAARTHKRSVFFNIYNDGGHDWFDGIFLALANHRTAVSVVSPWFGEWESTQGGIVPEFFQYDGVPAHYPWHNWDIVDVKMIQGVPYLVGKSWQGQNYGDGGDHYLSRETVNKVLEIYGAAAFVCLKDVPQDIQTIQISLYEKLINVLLQIMGLYRLN